jgi:hypothetical protein
MCFRRDERGLSVLRWWRDRCNEWCYARLEDGKFGDQKYLDDWPTRFPGISVAKNIGICVACWNQEGYTFSRTAEGSMVNGTPIVVFHYHNCHFVRPEFIVPIPDPVYKFSEGFIRHCLIPYVEHILRCLRRCEELYPGFAFGVAKERFELSGDQTFLVSEVLERTLQPIQVPQTRVPMNDGWVCYRSWQCRAGD